MRKRAIPLGEVQPLLPLPVVDSGFRTVLADPPWRFSNRTGKVAPEHRRLDRYSTLELADICAIDVKSIVAPNAHLYFWVPNALLPYGMNVIEAWGFRYVSNIVWAKRRKDGGPDGRGVGFYFRNVPEMLLFGVKGSMRTLQPARSQVNMIETRKREHSRKPDEQDALIESCSPGPFIELFARQARRGWTVWGDEADDEVVPRGRVFPGYVGGPIIAPQLPLHMRLEEETAHYLGEELKRYYEGGRSIREISDETNYSVGRVRSLLQKADTDFRSPGAPSHREQLETNQVADQEQLAQRH